MVIHIAIERCSFTGCRLNTGGQLRSLQKVQDDLFYQRLYEVRALVLIIAFPTARIEDTLLQAQASKKRKIHTFNKYIVRFIETAG